MKTFRFVLLIFFSSVLFSGCFLKSVHPLVTQDDAILVEGLEGIWESEDQRWTFINDPGKFKLSGVFDYEESKPTLEEEKFDNAYMILYENLQDLEEDTTVFIGAVTELNDNYYLDLYIFARDIKSLNYSTNTLPDNHYLPVHTFSKLTVDEENQINIEFFASSFINQLISSNRLRIKHEETDEYTLITASTGELRKFVAKYGNEEDAYEDGFSLDFRGFSIED